MKSVKILGKRGSWLAEVEGKQLAVLHDKLLGPGGEYKQLCYPETPLGKQHALLDALKTHDLAVLQKDSEAGSHNRGEPNHMRDGYVAVFRFTDLQIDDDLSFTLRFTERYAKPNN